MPRSSRRGRQIAQAGKIRENQAGFVAFEPRLSSQGHTSFEKIGMNIREVT
jgi:hypothetical protein